MSDSLRTALREGRPAGCWLSIPSAQVAEQAALAGPEFVVVDTEHAPADVKTVESMVRAVDAAGTGTAPLVRVAWNDHVRVKRALDTGAAGVMAPRVDTREEAERFAAAVRYPPAGRRGIAAARASEYGRTLDARVADAEPPVAVAQVESEAAVSNAAEIGGVDGIDSLFVGPADLSAALGRFGEFGAPRFVAAVETVLADSPVPVGTLATSAAQADRWAGMGFDYQIVTTDAGALARGFDAALSRYR